MSTEGGEKEGSSYLASAKDKASDALSSGDSTLIGIVPMAEVMAVAAVAAVVAEVIDMLHAAKTNVRFALRELGAALFPARTLTPSARSARSAPPCPRAWPT